MEKLRMGVIGLGNRGTGVLEDNLLKMSDLTISCVCDIYKDRVDDAVKAVKKSGTATPTSGTDYREFLDKKYMDAVYIATPWETHIPVAIDFLKAGIPVALEVGGAHDLNELYELIAVQEQTKTPFMFMENCCYGKQEMLAIAMAKAGIFGEIVHCSGAYGHDLRKEIAEGKENRHYRLPHYLNENRENYPTHELGPIAQILGINRGNRMVSLVSVASKAAGMAQYIADRKDSANPELIGKAFAQGDIVSTIITCENGETIHIMLDTTLPRSYDRQLTVRGTLGMYAQSLNLVFLDGDEERFDQVAFYKDNINNAAKYESDHLPDIWKNVTKEDLQRGHGGMDGFVFEAFIHALRTNSEMPIDVYDAAAWMSISCLSEQSIKNGGAPVAIPDFTNGKYRTRK